MPGPEIGRYESRCVVRSRRWLQNAVVIVPSWPSFNRRAVIVSSGFLLRFSASISATARCQAQMALYQISNAGCYIADVTSIK